MKDYGTDLHFPTVREYLRTCSPDCKVYVGCDSDPNSANTWALFTTTVVIHIFEGDIGKGQKIFGENSLERIYGKSGIAERLMRECYYAAEVAEQIRDIAEGRFETFEVHLDLNKDPEHKSNSVVGQATGYIRSLGFTPRIKPEAWAASAAAHKFPTIVHRLKQ